MCIYKVIIRSLDLYGQYQKESPERDGTTTALPSTGLDRWEVPPVGMLKLNIDGSCMSSKMAAAAVLRDHSGLFMAGVSQITGDGTPVVAEAQAVLLDLEFALHLKVTMVLVESDAQAVVRAISEPGYAVHWRAQHLIDKCKTVIRGHPQIFVGISFIPRSRNKAADSLATFANRRDLDQVWSELTLPPVVKDRLTEDCSFCNLV